MSKEAQSQTIGKMLMSWVAHVMEEEMLSMEMEDNIFSFMLCDRPHN